MAVNSCNEENSYFLAIANESCNLPISSCLQLIKPSFDEVNQHCSMDVLPILFDKATFPAGEKCPFYSSNGQDISSISELPNETQNNSECISQLSLFSFLEVPFPSKSQMCLDAPLNFQKCIDVKMENPDAYSSCIVGMDIEKEYTEALNCSEKVIGSLNSESILTNLQGAFQRQGSFKVGGKLLEILMKYGFMLLKSNSRDKSLTERVHEAPNNRWRRYKRAASFDSRKVVIFFSVLSSLGTLVLICLTLRVKLSIEEVINV